MNHRNTLYIIGLILLFFMTACDRQSRHLKEVTDLERDALLLGPQQADSLLAIADGLIKDSISDVIREARKARNLGAQEKYDSSSIYIKKVEDFCRRQKPSVRIYNLLAYIENVKGVNLIYALTSPAVLDSALQALENSAHYSRLGGSEDRLALVYYNIASLYQRQSKYALSADYNRKALFIADSLKFRFDQSFFLYETMGDSYLFMNDFHNAKLHYDKVASGIDKISPDDRITLYNSYGNLYDKQKAYLRATAYYEKAFQEARKVTIAKNYTYYSALQTYATALVKAGRDLQKAKSYLLQALHYYTANGDDTQLLDVRTALLSLAVKQKNRSEADKYVEAVRTGMENTGMETRDKISYYEALEHYFLWTQQYERAYQYNKKATALNDSIYGYRQQQYVADLNMRYQQDTTLLKHRIFIQQQEAKIKSLHWKYVAAILLGVVVILSFISYYIYTRRRRALLYHRYITNVNRLKMQNIRNCISPHFTFNVLNHEILLNSESKEKYNRLVELVRLLRKSLYTTEEGIISLAQELDFVDTYVHLLNECGKHFSYTLHVDDAVDTSQVMLPSMLLQIPVENAVKHGFTMDAPDHHLQVNIRKTMTGVDMEILNNGTAYSPFTQVRKGDAAGGIGMQVIFQFLLMMNMHNRHKIIFSITDRKAEGLPGTRVLIHIPDHFDYSSFKA